MQKVEDLIKTVVANAISLYKDAPEGTEVCLVTYTAETKKYLNKFFPELPLALHYEIIENVKEELEEMGVKVILVPFDPERYEKYLRNTHSQDTQDKRAEWAAFTGDKIIN